MIACNLDFSNGSWCEHILDCELAMLPESKKCKKVIAWSGDFGIDQYVLCCLPTQVSLAK